MYKYVFPLVALLLGEGGFCPKVFAQHSPSKKKLISRLNLEPVFGLQVWSTFTTGAKLFNEELQSYLPVDNRINTQIRRTRMGFIAKPYESLKIVFVASMDLVGRDVLAGTNGGSNNGPIPKLGLWNGYFQWKIHKKSSLFNLVGGYLTPQFSRESLTSAFAVNSLEKAFTQNYIRRHLVGTGPGRAMGVNLGGLWLQRQLVLGLNYNIGVFNPVFHGYDGNSTGAASSLLYVGRIVIYMGDPEMSQYAIGGKINYLGKRNGLSLGFGGSYQGTTGLFQESFAYGVDMLLNLGKFSLDGEWMLFYREGFIEQDINHVIAPSYNNQAGHLRVGYSIPITTKTYVEPTFLVSRFQGGKTEQAYIAARAISGSSGVDQTYDLGINWHLNKGKQKIGVHYTWRKGELGEAPEGSIANLHFYQNGAGAIVRGNWIGLGLIIKL